MSSNPSQRRIPAGLALATAVFGAGAVPGHVSAEDTDVRNIRPAVMLLVDTSGSMETAVDVRSGSIAGRVANCAASPPERDRWITLLEVLTGTFQGYGCAQYPRSTFVGQPDADYVVPFTFPTYTSQLSDGVLDTYYERVKFGFMGYDNIWGLRGMTDTELTMVEAAAWNSAAAQTVSGDYSYGPDQILTFPGCLSNYKVNAGTRNTFFSYGVDSTADPNLFKTINSNIQAALLGVDTTTGTRSPNNAIRPFGATPTGALLQDYEYFLNNHPDAAPGASDPYASCRDQYAILVSDGQPADPFRGGRVNCDTSGYTCPYDLPATTVQRICQVGGSGTCTSSRFRGLFTVLFQPGGSADSDVAQALSSMNNLAALGGTGNAYTASDASSLRAAISAALDRASPGTRTRTTPTFVSTASSYRSASGAQGQFQITSGFLVGSTTTSGTTTTTTPWRGVLNRQRWECDGTTPVQRTLSATDRFADVLNTQSSRDIRGVRTANPAYRNGIIINADVATTAPLPAASTGSTTRTTVTGTGFTSLTTSNFSPEYFNLAASDSTTRDTTVRWVRAESGSGRESYKLGDIYHATPVVVTPPQSDIADESYNQFRRRTDVAGRPAVVFTATNDGLLHAMSLEDYTSSTGSSYSAGYEFWAFAPPALMDRMPGAVSAHGFLLDGTPVVRDVFYRRLPGAAPDGSTYHTVLVGGFRQGGRGYYALDVTNPLSPVFLWQWTHDDLGDTYGRPALAQVLVNRGSGEEERAVAILPGGAGDRASGSCTFNAANRAPQSENQTSASRSAGLCWSSRRGRSFHVVDVATGESIRSWTADELQTTFTGGVSLFTGTTGSIATRAYTTSDDGVLWRLDMTSPLPSEWTFRPLHDVYWKNTASQGQSSAEPPIVSVNDEYQPVIIVGMGDLDNMETPGVNYIVSITDTTTTPTAVSGKINWEIRLRENEMVTGPLELFDGRVYFGTFFSTVTPTDACSFGTSRIWGVDYIASGGAIPSDYPAPGSGLFPAYGWEADTAVGTGTFTKHFMDLGSNQFVMGVGVTQRPTCVVGTNTSDPYLGSRFQTTGVGGGSFQLVAQVSTTSTASTTTPAEVSTVTRSLPPPASYTRTLSQAPQVDF